jgi:hypothetical protein
MIKGPKLRLKAIEPRMAPKTLRELNIHEHFNLYNHTLLKTRPVIIALFCVTEGLLKLYAGQFFLFYYSQNICAQFELSKNVIR